MHIRLIPLVSLAGAGPFQRIAAAQALPTRAAARAAIEAKRTNPYMTVELRTRSPLYGPCEGQDQPSVALARATRLVEFRTVSQYGSGGCQATFTKEGLAVPVVRLTPGQPVPPVYRQAFDTTTLVFVAARDTTGPVTLVSVGPQPGTAYADYSWGWVPTPLGRQYADQLKLPFGVPFGTLKSDRATLRRSYRGWQLESTASLEEFKARGGRAY